MTSTTARVVMIRMRTKIFIAKRRAHKARMTELTWMTQMKRTSTHGAIAIAKAKALTRISKATKLWSQRSFRTAHGYGAISF